MGFFSTVAAFCFIACHAGPADHFSTFAQALGQRGYPVQVYGNGEALKKFQERQITQVAAFSMNEEGVLQIAKRCDEKTVIITDLGDPFDIELQKFLALYATKSLRLTYYDNPEAFVPGGYSTVAAKVMLAAQGVLFANAHLALQPIYETPTKSIELPLIRRVGVGYFPISAAEEMGLRRLKERESKRSALLDKYGLLEQGQKILVYVGGNNEEYYTKAFPAFLQMLSQIKDVNALVLFQQHPGAREKNRDGDLILEWKKKQGQQQTIPFLVSEMSSDEVQVLADAMLYYQTSMGPRFVLSGIPTIQVGDAVYEDILVRHGLCVAATDDASFRDGLSDLTRDYALEAHYEALLHALSFRPDWINCLEQSVDHFIAVCR
jgi:hypothetical protein